MIAHSLTVGSMIAHSLTVGWAILVMMVVLHHLPGVVGGSDDSYTRADFPSDFVFGSGTSAYQVEGAAFEDGKTPSIWDSYTHSGHNGGANGDVACDHYHKYKEDVQLMADVGLEAYRFSISWPRLIPNGRGPVNPKALLFYNNLINELISNDIKPHVTLVHVDIPQALEDEYGGWLSRDILKDFMMYVDVCFREFGNRVSHWTTVNEANIWALGGYDNALMPPGHCSYPFGKVCTKGNSSVEPYIAFHNMLLAHSSAVKLYNKRYKITQHGFIGINIYTFSFLPLRNLTEDVIASQRAYDYHIGWVAHPLVYGDYPEVLKKNAGIRIPAFTPSETKQLKGSFDFFGVNYYTPVKVKNDPSLLNLETRDVYADMAMDLIVDIVDAPPDQKPSSPLGLYQVLQYFKDNYGNPPIFIHENGHSSVRNGSLNDTARVSFLQAHIGAILDAVRNGSNARGYFYWSFLDGFELLSGFKTGFGLYYVDLDDPELKRYPKLSAGWYSDFLKGRSVM